VDGLVLWALVKNGYLLNLSQDVLIKIDIFRHWDQGLKL
jgi:hypothetical protein